MVTSFLQVFVRELISNGSDALEKLRHKLMSEGKTLPNLEIHLETDAQKGTISIQVLHAFFPPGAPWLLQGSPALAHVLSQSLLPKRRVPWEFTCLPAKTVLPDGTWVVGTFPSPPFAIRRD